MLAYQFIYTACGKDKNGAFSTWSKSSSITASEEEQIIRLMNYRMPPNLPYNPTEEEIKTLFPKQIAYFVLSTGRKCIAQTSYIGTVYSEGGMDRRTGNFIIHALVFDELEDGCAFHSIDNSILKTALTYKEWHDDPIIEDYPTIDVSFEPKMSENIIKKYIVNGNRNIIASLLQSVLNVTNEDKTVTIHSSYDEEKELYNLISFIVPKCLQGSLTFANQYVSNIEHTFTGQNFEKIKLRNMSNEDYVFNYSASIGAGLYAFDFEKNNFSNVEAGKYVNTVIDLLKTKGTMNAMQYINKINELIKKYKCSADDAADIQNLLNNDYASFKSAEEYIKVLEIVEDYGFNTSAILGDIYTNVIKNKRWGFSKQIAPLIKRVYKCATKEIKEEFIYEFLRALDKFDISPDADKSHFVHAIRNNDLIAYEDVKAAIVRNTVKWKSTLESSPNYVYLAYVCVADSLKNATSKEEQAEKLNYTGAIFISATAKKDKALIEDYFKVAIDLGVQYERCFIKNAISKYSNGPCQTKEDFEYTLYLISLLTDNATKVQFGSELFAKNINQPYFVDVYTRMKSSSPAFMEKIENALSNNDDFKKFSTQREMIAFETEAEVTERSLEEYFKKYYINGLDNGAYVRQLKRYLLSLSPKMRLMKVFDYFEKIEKFIGKENSAMDIVNLVEKEAYAYDMDTLSSLGRIQIEILRKIDVIKNGSTKFKYLIICLRLKGKVDSKDLDDAIKNEKLYKELDKKECAEFARKNFKVVFEAYLEFTKKYKKQIEKELVKKESFIFAMIKPLIEPEIDIRDEFNRALEALSKEDRAKVLADFLPYALNNKDDDFGSKLYEYVDRYFASLKKSPCKKQYAQMRKYTDKLDKGDREKIDKYLVERIEEKPGFLYELLFGKK